jgi:cobalt-zinc-cadmium efflux system membrane fusion protein
LRWLWGAIPAFLVLSVLAGVAYVGHQTGWTMPKFSALLGKDETEKDDWCETHGISQSQCVECNPDLLPKPKTYGWCKEHGVQECPLHHPDVAQLDEPPHIMPADFERAQLACDFAERPANKPECTLHTHRIQLASEEAMDKAGIKREAAEEHRVEEAVIAFGESGYDSAYVASLATPVAGRIWRVEEKGKFGQAVRKGDVLALVDAVEIGKAKGEFLHALAQVDLKKKTVDRMKEVQGTVLPAGTYHEAEAALREAEIRLLTAEQALVNLGLPIGAADVKGLSPEELARRTQFLGLPEELARGLDPRTTSANLIPIKAPFDGVVVERQAVMGEMVNAVRSLFTVADTRHMWLTLNVPFDSFKPFREKDPRRLLGGKSVLFTMDTGDEVSGKVSWISTAVDEKTHTLQVRAELPNPDGRLRANVFGSGRIVLRVEERAITVPNEAVHWDGNCNVVFVWDKNSSKEDAPKVFHVRTVVPGVKDGQYTEIIAGLLPGERVATRNSNVLRAELLKASLGGE